MKQYVVHSHDYMYPLYLKKGILTRFYFTYLGYVLEVDPNSDVGGLVQGGQVVLLVVPRDAQPLLCALGSKEGLVGKHKISGLVLFFIQVNG